MDFKQRVILGAIGGITPYLVTLLSIDFKSAVLSYEVLDWVGLIVRCFILTFLGSLVAYLHKAENEPFKLFQLGLAAPALLATFINGGAGNNEALPSPVKAGNYTISVFREAVAEDGTYVNSGMLREPKVSGASRFFRGLFGTKLKTTEGETYFVIVGSHKQYEQAKKQADNLENKNYKAEVFNPYGLSKYYGVVIASNVSREEAIHLRDKAIADGLPSDSYIWTY